jgi:c-di-AMP phosphodiesterase-like protein
MKYKYARIDCDNVGDKIELCLYDLKPEKAQEINNLIRQNIQELAEKIKAKLEWEILLVGPDDILFRSPNESFDIDKLKSLKESFFTNTGITLSVGVGDNIIEAMRNLDIAKKSGKNKIYPSS